jgi:hypothetical protein
VVDANGNVSTTERNNIKYLEGDEIKKIKGEEKRGQYVTSYDEVNVDQFGNKTTRTFTNGTYQRLGDNWYLTGYNEKGVDQYGNVTETVRRGGTYVHNDNFRELKSIHTTRQEFMLSSYTQTIVSPNGLTHTEFWRNAVYDNRDNLISFNQTNLNADNLLPVEIEFRKGTYDRYGRQVGYERTETSANTKVKTTRFNTVYNKIGDVTGYSETTESSDGMRTRIDRFGVIYNSKRQQMGYQETLIGQDGSLTTVSWSAKQPGLKDTAVAQMGELGYDAQGRLIGFEQTMRSGDTTQVQTTTNITFDNLGAQASSLQITQTTDTSGLDVTHVVDTKRLTTEYNGPNGQVSATTDDVTDYGYDTKSKIILRDLIVHIVRTGITLAGFFETKTTTGGNKRLENGQDTSETINQVTTELRSGNTYDGNGRVFSYGQVSTDSNTERTTVSQFTNLVYDTQGRLVSSHEAAEDNFNVRTETDRQQISYDPFGRIANAVTVTRTITAGTDITSTAHRTGIQYNGFGDVNRYVEAVTSSASPNLTQTTTWHGDEFSVLGRLRASTSVQHNTGTSENGETLDNILPEV